MSLATKFLISAELFPNTYQVPNDIFNLLTIGGAPTYVRFANVTFQFVVKPDTVEST